MSFKLELIEDHVRDWDVCYFTVKATDLEIGIQVDVSFTWQDGKFIISADNEPMNQFQNMCDFILINKVTQCIMDNFTEDHEMYSDIFADANGDSFVTYTVHDDGTSTKDIQAES
tara:strand:- start:67998 stop:68342 length:345 start_codon:yes stop_codon:yes gene_type:complete